jgi:hypothetical protein
MPERQRYIAPLAARRLEGLDIALDRVEAGDAQSRPFGSAAE